MADRLSPKSADRFWTAEEFARRLALARAADPEPAEKPSVWQLLAEISVLREPLIRPFRTLDIARAETPQTVMLLPGFATHPTRMRFMARQLERAGHTVKRWGLGFNLGPTPDNIEFLEQRLTDVQQRYGRDVVLVGWSLGGLFARELAKRHPGKVAKVITMGSPFSGNPRANNAWRAYQFIAGHPVDEPPIPGDVKLKPPVPTIAFWSKRDGIVSPAASRGIAGERDRAVCVDCNHIGFSNSAASILAILKELEDI
ncbi:alpha/beta fold hydrolase [Pontixanthobacter sp.]|uniref:alpha/beta fold hydrolase n=1 Tax=Pontixanthobacter sp. TaxID=2792078 RepID=UPI003C798700